MGPKRDDETAVTIRFPNDVHQEAVEAAKLDERSFNLWVVRAIREKLDQDRKGKKGGK